MESLPHQAELFRFSDLNTSSAHSLIANRSVGSTKSTCRHMCCYKDENLLLKNEILLLKDEVAHLKDKLLEYQWSPSPLSAEGRSWADYQDLSETYDI